MNPVRRATAIAAMILTLAACSTGAATTSPSAAQPSTAGAASPAASSGGQSVAPSAATSPAGSAASSPAASAAPITVPEAIKTAGKIVWCVDVSYPPEEFFAEDGTTAQGSDVDIANDIARRFGVKAQIDNTGFDGIIPALLARKCDMIISGMNSTDERKKQVDFVDYLKVGQSLLVPAGNPDNIKSLDDLAGKAVAVQLGTTNADRLEEKSKEFVAAGKEKIDVQTFQADSDAFQQLAIGRVQAFFTDSPVVVYYNTLPANAGKFEVGGTPIEPLPIGIAIRKEDTELKSAVQAAIDAMYADGTIKSIVDKWGMTPAVELLK